MHPEIRAFPSHHFYGNALTDGRSDCHAAWHKDSRFPPIVMYDVRGGKTEGGSGASLFNEAEARVVAAAIYAMNRAHFGGAGGIRGMAAVLTPYGRQVKEISKALQQKGLGFIEVSTVDSFQGREAEIIVISTVRASMTAGLGFVKDVRRMNVAITRARSTLVIVGDASALSRSTHWSALVEYVKGLGRFVTVEMGQEEKIFRERA